MQKAKQTAKNSALKKQKDESKALKNKAKSQSKQNEIHNKQAKIQKNDNKALKIQSKSQKIQSKAQKKSQQNTANSKKDIKNSKQRAEFLKQMPKNSKQSAENFKQSVKNSSQIQNDNKSAQKVSQKFLARQEKIKAVALKMFISKGYEDTSLKDIIKKSGGSFTDIYATFENKQGLFVSVIEDVLEEKRVEYGQIFTKNLPLRETLLTFSLNIMNSFLQKKTLALLKMLYSQLYNKTNHALIEHFKRSREQIPEHALITYFQSQKAPLCDKPEKYAELFFTILKGKCLEEMFFFEVSMSQKEREEHANFIVDFFIKAVS
mgnify:CR=1 FL=1